MRLVVDTNVFVSAALKEKSWLGRVIEWVDKYGGLIKSHGTEDEVFEVTQKPRIAEDSGPLFVPKLRCIFAKAELTPITKRIQACRDPKDDKFLELAVNGHAEFIVSNDKDLLVLRMFRDIPIISPTEFGQIRMM